MNKNKLFLVLALVAGGLCVGKFMHSYFKSNELDYTILLAGLFIIGFGINSSLTKR